MIDRTTSQLKLLLSQPNFCQLIKILISFLFFPLSVFAQNTIALPHVTNYTKQSYKGGLQNWKLKQDRSGIIYIANNEGMLTFDGNYWELYPLTNKTIVRSLEISSDGKIFAGGQDEAGYFLPNKRGRLEYHSIIDKIPPQYRSFGDIWDIIELEESIYFRANNYIFKWNSGKITVYPARKEWLFMGKWENKLYAQDQGLGLFVQNNGFWEKVRNENTFNGIDPITSIIGLESGKAFISTLKSGVYIFDGAIVSSETLQNQELFRNERIYATALLPSNEIALATNNAGIIIIASNGEVIQKISTDQGLQNNNVLSIFSDKQGNLWLGLDNGIDLVAYGSAIKQINPLQRNGSGYAAIVKNNQLYIGTSNGLYRTALEQKKDLSFSIGAFTSVNNSKGQVWGLAEISGKLLLGHHEGAFEVKENDATLINHNTGFWNFSPAADNKVIAGTYTGLDIFPVGTTSGESFSPIPSFTESSRYLVIDKENNIWVSHPYHGVYKISELTENKFNIQRFSTSEGLPSQLNNHIFKIKNELVAATIEGIYILDREQNRFVPSPWYQKILGDQSIRYLKESPTGNIWYMHEKSLGVIDLSGKQPVLVPIPALNNKMLSGFEFIYATDESNIFLGGESGFYHINYQKYLETITPLVAQVRAVHIFNKGDSMIFGGYFAPLTELQKQQGDFPVVSNDWKSIQFTYSAISFGAENDLEYAVRLKGFDNNWSDWSKRTDKEYTNLGGGTYIFEVKVRNSLNKESAVASYKFKMLPPWYLTNLALFIYFIIFCLGNFLMYKWLKKKFRMQRQKYEEEQKRINYIHGLEQNKTRNELITLKNEKLEADISFKNAELAAAAMHLVKKGELLTKIKDDLTHVSKEIRNPEAISAIKKMVKKVGEDDKLDEEWENFAKHFDSVHSDYLVNLKEKHPNLTGNELKLCANLRMNLSTKEIAQLMNISVRGVEISRYRLRKKLELSSGDNLFDYLMKI